MNCRLSAGNHGGCEISNAGEPRRDQPRLRPVSPVKTDGFIVYVANLKAYHKTQEIAANPNVELLRTADMIRCVTGRAEVLTTLTRFNPSGTVNPLLRQYPLPRTTPC